MRLSEEQIKQAILHPELPVRTLALHYFTKSFSQNNTVMPLVIEAVEKYGREKSIQFIGEGKNLPQTESTIEWCIEELRQDFGEQFKNIDNYKLALSKILANADLSLILSKESEILELPGFIPNISSTLSHRIHLRSDDTEALWDKLMYFCEQEFEKQYITDIDLPHANRLIEALARGGDTIADKVLSMLDEVIDYSVNSPRALMQGFVLRLAGELRLKQAVPFLMEALKEDDDWFNEECLRALIKIGGDAVLDALLKEFPTADWSFRLYGSGILEEMHTEQSVEKCLELFHIENDEAIKICLGRAALSQFSSEAIDPVRQFILTSEVDAEIIELRECLVSVSTLFDVEFPEREEWKKENEKSRILFEQRIAEIERNTSDSPTDWEDDYSEELEDDFDYDEPIEPIYSPDTIVNQSPKIGRNEPCPCGSGKKYKKCCMKKTNGNPLFN